MARMIRVFVRWMLILSLLWIALNWPRDGGSLKWFLQWAGFPWTFAFWDFGKLEWFDFSALAADAAIGVVVVIAVAGLCAWSHRENGCSPRRQGE